MIVTKQKVLDYLSQRGFMIKPGKGAHLSSFPLSEWDRKFRPKGAFEFVKWEESGLLTLKPAYTGRAVQYVLKSNLRLLFSKLEVSAGEMGSLVVNSQRPIFTEPAQSDEGDDLAYVWMKYNYFEIHLLNASEE